MRTLKFIAFIALLLCTLCACTTARKSNTAQTEPASQTYTEPDFYYDFDDILIPKEIDYLEDESYKLDNTKFRAAIMKFSGRVEVLELVQFFLNNMAKDNWTLVSNNKTGKLSTLNFEKYNKSCAIQVDDSFGSAKTVIIAVEVKGLDDVSTK